MKSLHRIPKDLDYNILSGFNALPEGAVDPSQKDLSSISYPNVNLVANPEEEFIGFTSNVVDCKVNASFPDTPLEFWSG